MIVKQSKKIALSLLLVNSLAFGASNLETGVQELGKNIAKSMINKKKKKLAIIEFSDLNDNVNDLGRYLPEKLITELFKLNSEGFSIIERRQLSKVLKEQKLSTTGLIDSKTMQKVGKILGVDALVTGSITDLGNIIEVNARIISVETGDIIGTASSRIPKVGTVATLLSQNNQKSPTASDSSSEKSSSTKVVSKSKSLKFSNRYFHILIDKIEKNGDEITLSCNIQNRTDKWLRININQKETTITNEKNKVWDNMANTLFNSKNDLDFNPKEGKTPKLTFISDGVKNGNKFNIVIEFSITNINNFYTKMEPKPVKIVATFNSVKI